MPIAAAALPIVLPILKAFASRIKDRIKARRRGKQVRRVTIDYKDLAELVKAAAGNSFSRTTGELDEHEFIKTAVVSDELQVLRDIAGTLKDIYRFGPGTNKLG